MGSSHLGVRILIGLTMAAAASLPLAPLLLARDVPADAVELEPLVVTAPVQPLDRSLELLRVLVEQSAPCLGCDTVPLRHAVPALSLLQYLLLPAVPPEVDEATRLAHEVKLQDSPDLDYLRR